MAKGHEAADKSSRNDADDSVINPYTRPYKPTPLTPEARERCQGDGK